MVFSEVVGTLSFLQPQHDDDHADRMHYYYTSTFLLVTAVLISLKMFGGRPLECFMPAEFRSSWEDYTEIFCWASNTYWIDKNEPFPESEETRKERMISYYQWSPFFLVICAFLFYSPCLFWRILYTKSGIKLTDLMVFANDPTNIKPERREAHLKGMSEHLGSIFRHQFKFGSSQNFTHKYLKLLNLRYYEAYLTSLYLLIKVLYLFNVLAQMYLINWFLQTDNYTFYGFGVLSDLFRGIPWTESGNFPRVTYCDMDIRILGNVQKHTVQCVLVINIFIEKIFVILWIWYTLLVCTTLISLFNWTFSTIPFGARKKFISRKLELADIDFQVNHNPDDLNEFVREYIKVDGAFVLKMLSIHAGNLMCAELMDTMWEDFQEQINKAKLPPTPEPTTPTAGGRRKISMMQPLIARDPYKPVESASPGNLGLANASEGILRMPSFGPR